MPQENTTNVYIAAERLDGRVWQKYGKSRVYLDCQKGSTAWIAFDEVVHESNFNPEWGWMTAGKLHVYTEAEDKYWAVSQSKQIKHGWMLKIAEHIGVKVAEDWRDVKL